MKNYVDCPLCRRYNEDTEGYVTDKILKGDFIQWQPLDKEVTVIR